MKIGPYLRSLRGNYSLKLSLVVVCMIMLLTFLSNFSFFLHENRQLSRDIRRQGETVVKLLAQNSKAGIFTHNLDALADSARAVLRQEDFMDVLIFENKGNLLLSRHDPEKEPPQPGASAIPAPEKLIVNLSRSPGNQVYTLETESVFLFGFPVEDDNSFSDNRLFFPDSMLPALDEPGQQPGSHRIGYVAISISKVRLQKELHHFLMQSGALAGGMALLIGLLSMLLLDRIGKPLFTLIKNVRGQGRPEEEDDDLNLLTANFSELMASVASAFTTINRMKEELEETVRQRTAELSQANLQLNDKTAFLEEANNKFVATLHELKNTQAQLIQSEKMAALGVVVSGVGHEINNTINFISGALPPLKGTIADLKEAIEAARLPEVITADNSQYFLTKLARRQATTDFDGLLAQIDLLLNNIEEGANRTTNIVQDLKSFSRASGSAFAPANLHEGLTSTLTITRHECQGRIAIVTDLAPALPLVDCLGGQINQVFLNILTNAIQAIPQEGRIAIKSWATAEEVHFSFSDNGVGIPAEIIPKIFDPFFTTKEIGKGTGLGLGVSYQIVRKHGGQIKVNSQLGVGSVFELILPLRQKKEFG